MLKNVALENTINPANHLTPDRELSSSIARPIAHDTLVTMAHQDMTLMRKLLEKETSYEALESFVQSVETFGLSPATVSFAKSVGLDLNSLEGAPSISAESLDTVSTEGLIDFLKEKITQFNRWMLERSATTNYLVVKDIRTQCQSVDGYYRRQIAGVLSDLQHRTPSNERYATLTLSSFPDSDRLDAIMHACAQIPKVVEQICQHPYPLTREEFTRYLHDVNGLMKPLTEAWGKVVVEPGEVSDNRQGLGAGVFAPRYTTSGTMQSLGYTVEKVREIASTATAAFCNGDATFAHVAQNIVDITKKQAEYRRENNLDAVRTLTRTQLMTYDVAWTMVNSNYTAAYHVAWMLNAFNEILFTDAKD